MRVLIVVPSQDRVSGNWVSAERFQQGLLTLGHSVVIEETGLKAGQSLRKKILGFDPDVAILLHAYRTGKPWLDAMVDQKIPTVVLLTGTDINHGLDDPKQSGVIRKTLHQAACVLSQNPLLVNALTSSHPGLTANLHELPPGIKLGTAPYPLRDLHHLAKDKVLFLCPAGLRPVKGVLELLEIFDQVATQSSGCLLAFCGPVLDQEYNQRFQSALEERPWAHYLGTIPKQAMASAMCEADVILNNSQTEGLANSLLEAATLGIPILAHNIPGNVAVVNHETNGLLYSNHKDFVKYAVQLINHGRRKALSFPDPNRFNPDKEAIALVKFLQEAAIMNS